MAKKKEKISRDSRILCLIECICERNGHDLEAVLVDVVRDIEKDCDRDDATFYPPIYREIGMFENLGDINF